MVNVFRRPVTCWTWVLLLAQIMSSGFILKLQWHWPPAEFIAAPMRCPLMR